MNMSELKKLLRKSWTKKTSKDPRNWTPKNPAWGQCAVTALVVQDFFGGELRRGIVEINEKDVSLYLSHYWNLLPDGKKKDLTKEQFPKGTVIPRKGEPQSRDYVLSFPDTRKRYALLRLAIENQIQLKKV